MAAKKTAKKTTESVIQAPEAAKAPVAKKAAKKAAAKKVALPKAEKPTTPKVVVSVPSPDAIARAAYLNYRRRVEEGLPGDSHGDWLEAERQLS